VGRERRQLGRQWPRKAASRARLHPSGSWRLPGRAPWARPHV